MSSLRQLIQGARTTQLLYVATVLGIPELLAEQPRSADDLAAACGADAAALRRALRGLVLIEVVTEREGIFALTELGLELRSSRAQVLVSGRPYVWRAWGELLHSVQTGATAFDSIFGQSVWDYRAAHPDESKLFDEFMTEATRGVDDAIVCAYDFGRFAHVVDIAGGQGAFLAAILRARPQTRGTLFDQPHVVPAEGPFEIVAGSFFDDAIPRGADAYVLKWIVHDWDDERAAAILRNVARALHPGSRVLVVERDLADPAAVWIDLQMLIMAGGRERTEEEYAALFAAAGLEHAGTTSVGAGHAVYEARQGAAMSPRR
jgi:hypothetical protein